MQNNVQENYIEEKGSLEMQSKRVRYHFTPTKIGVKFLKPDNKCWYWCRETGALLHGFVGVWHDLCTLENGLEVSYKVEYLFCDPAITFLGIFPREICISFIHNSSKLEKNPNVHHRKWINTLLYLYTREYYSRREKNKLLIHGALMLLRKLRWAKEAG